MKFRKKPVVVEAFQMTKETRASNADWPTWMHEAWQKALVEGSAEFRRKPVPKPDFVKIGSVVIDSRDYLAWGYESKRNVEFTFTADGVLKSARVLK